MVYHNDHSRPERPVLRTLEEEIGRVMRARVVNPKWIAGVMRHGYKGAFEIAATVDYMFAFAATTGAVQSHHFDLAYDAYLGDPPRSAPSSPTTTPPPSPRSPPASPRRWSAACGRRGPIRPGAICSDIEKEPAA